MKKLIVLSLFLLSFFGITGCCSNDENITNTIIAPITISDTLVLDFFKYELPLYTRSTSFFTEFDYNNINDSCIAINSMEEFIAVYRGLNIIPNIDFGKYTLILGIVSTNGDAIIVSHNATLEATNMWINVYLKDKTDAALSIISFKYFWGLYPKTNSERIKIKKIYHGSVWK